MKSKVGLWIDHKKAVIVEISDKGEKTKVIPSNVEKQAGRFKGLRSTTSYESQKVQADDVQDRKFMGHLDTYYDKVISYIRDAESILLFGPGEAKGELTKRLKNHGQNGREVSVETVDKLTDHQIVAKVREHFGNNHESRG